MKSIKYIITICLIAFSLSVFADKKMTLRNSDTGESFEVMVPDGLRIYEYNSNWLDSIPYLIEHARWGEPWAYEALGDCYRDGKGGVKMSIVKPLGYYDLAGMDIDAIISEIAKIDRDNPFAVMPRFINYLEDRNYDKVLCALDTLNEYDYHSADILRTYIHRKTEKVALSEILEYITSKDTDADAAFFAAGGAPIYLKLDSIKTDVSSFIHVLMNKIPFLYSQFGERKYKKTIKADTPDGYAEDVTIQDIEDRKKAVEYLLKADELGVLSKEGTRLIIDYCTNDSTSNWVMMSEEDWMRIEQIADIRE